MNCPNCKAANADDARFCGACGQTLSTTESSGSTAGGEAPSLIGREIAGRYRMQAKLGEGGMGAVYKAEQISLKRQVAVKLLRPEVAGAQMLLQRFNAEAQVVAKLSHPNTVNIYDFGQDSDGTLFIAMEFIEGKSLRQVIHHEAPLPLRRALAIAAQVAASLTDAHAHGIVHRDLKPDNVMLQDRGRQRDVVRVLDFGIAKLRDENRQSQFAMTQAGDMLGTPQYMAPEQIRGDSIDGRTDIYALGGMLYEMVTGRLPFEAPTVMALLSKHLLETIVPPSQRRPDLQLPPAVDSLILGAMAKEAAQRPQSMELFGEQIAALLATFPVDTAQATAQVVAQSGGMTRPQSIPTPAAYSAVPATAAQPWMPHTPPPVSPTAAVGAPPMMAGPTAPYAHPAHPPPPVARPSGGGKGIWVLLSLLVVAGIGTGVYFGVMKRNSGGGGGGSGSDQKDPGSDVATVTADATTLSAPPPVVDAAPLPSGEDPWQKGGGTTIVPPIGGNTNGSAEAGDDDSGEEEAATPTPKPKPKPQTAGSKGLPPACEEYARTIEALSKCSIMPKQSRDAMLQAVKQMRQGYGSIQMTPQIAKQLTDACTQGDTAIKQSMKAYNCL